MAQSIWAEDSGGSFTSRLQVNKEENMTNILESKRIRKLSQNKICARVLVILSGLDV